MARKSDSLSSVQRAANLIRDRISAGDWGPGHRLVESDLTDELDISRGPLREAFGRLEAEGLLTIEPFKGAMVRRLTPEDLESIYEVREVLEGLAARLVAARVADPAIRSRVVELLTRTENLGENPNRYEFFDENSHMHHTLIELSGNLNVIQATARFETQIYRYSMRRMLADSSLSTSRAEHLSVMKAVLAGDGELAEALMRAHVRSSGAAVLAALADAEANSAG